MVARCSVTRHFAHGYYAAFTPAFGLPCVCCWLFTVTLRGCLAGFTRSVTRLHTLPVVVRFDLRVRALRSGWLVVGYLRLPAHLMPVTHGCLHLWRCLRSSTLFTVTLPLDLFYFTVAFRSRSRLVTWFCCGYVVWLFTRRLRCCTHVLAGYVPVNTFHTDITALRLPFAFARFALVCVCFARSLRAPLRYVADDDLRVCLARLFRTGVAVDFTITARCGGLPRRLIVYVAHRTRWFVTHGYCVSPLCVALRVCYGLPVVHLQFCPLTLCWFAFYLLYLAFARDSPRITVPGCVVAIRCYPVTYGWLLYAFYVPHVGCCYVYHARCIYLPVTPCLRPTLPVLRYVTLPVAQFYAVVTRVCVSGYRTVYIAFGCLRSLHAVVWCITLVCPARLIHICVRFPVDFDSLFIVPHVAALRLPPVPFYGYRLVFDPLRRDVGYVVCGTVTR